MTDRTDSAITVPTMTDTDTQLAVWFLGSLVQFRVPGEHTANVFALLEHHSSRGRGAPQHIHRHDDEIFFVLDGELRFQVGQEDHLAGPGTVAELPRGVDHGFVVRSGTAHFVSVHSPAGFADQLITAVGTQPQGLVVPPPPDVPPDLAALTATAARYGIDIIGSLPDPEASPRG